MNKKIFISVLCVFAITTSYCFADTENNKPNKFEAEILVPPLKPSFVMDGGPMFPHNDCNSPFPPEPPIMMIQQLDKQLDLTDKQKKQIRELSEKHRNAVHELHETEKELRFEYLEKFEAVLTDEQFRKIERMRKDLRKDMEKIQNKQHKLIIEHRHDFEKILTEKQKQELEKLHIKPKMHMQKP